MIVLDTHVLVWWANDDDQLSDTARTMIATELASTQTVLVSSISIWEIALLVVHGRLILSMALDRWLAAVYGLPGLRIATLTAEQAVASVRLPGDFHRDPADRFIVALARMHGAALVTADRRIRSYPHVHSAW